MGFGRNPHVAKAEQAEQKAADSLDDDTRRRAYRDAAHQWDRAAAREKPGKQREQYERKAAENRSIADGDLPELDALPAEAQGEPDVGTDDDVLVAEEPPHHERPVVLDQRFLN